jgi:hypothetical protein
MKDPKYPLKMKAVERRQADRPPFLPCGGGGAVTWGRGGGGWHEGPWKFRKQRAGQDTFTHREIIYLEENLGTIPPCSFISVYVFCLLLYVAWRAGTTNGVIVPGRQGYRGWRNRFFGYIPGPLNVYKFGLKLGRQEGPWIFLYRQKVLWVFLYVCYFSMLSPNTDRKMWQVSGFPSNRDNTRKLFGAPQTDCSINSIKRAESRDRLQSFW